MLHVVTSLHVRVSGQFHLLLLVLAGTKQTLQGSLLLSRTLVLEKNKLLGCGRRAPKISDRRLTILFCSTFGVPWPQRIQDNPISLHQHSSLLRLVKACARQLNTKQCLPYFGIIDKHSMLSQQRCWRATRLLRDLRHAWSSGSVDGQGHGCDYEWPERIKTQPHDDRDNCFLPFDSKGAPAV